MEVSLRTLEQKGPEEKGEPQEGELRKQERDSGIGIVEHEAERWMLVRSDKRIQPA